MPNSALFDVILRVADDREFRELLVADPDAVGRAYRLDLEERLVIRGMADYSFVPGRRTAFDRVAFANLLAVFLKLAIEDASNDPDLFRRLGEVARELGDRGNDLEARRLEAIAEERDEAAACEQSMKALAYVVLAVMLIVLLVLLFGEPDDPPN